MTNWLQTVHYGRIGYEIIRLFPHIFLSNPMILSILSWMRSILAVQNIFKPKKYYFQIDNFHFQVKSLSFYVVKMGIFKLNFKIEQIRADVWD